MIIGDYNHIVKKLKMGRRRKRRSDGAGVEMSACGARGCKNNGRCVVSAAGGAGCACTGPWGGAGCAQYVGHDHVCLTLHCSPPALCVWPSPAHDAASTAAYCACPADAACGPGTAAGPYSVGSGGGGSLPSRGGAGGAWAGSVLGALGVAALALAAVYWRRRQRQSAFVHARLADNVEISNPMYLAGEGEGDDDEPPAPHTHANGGSHFANPVYESLYAPPAGPRPRRAPPEECANLLAEAPGEGSHPPPELAALL